MNQMHEIKRYKKLTEEIINTLEDFEATYGEAFDALKGVERQLNLKLNEIRIDLPEGIR